MMPAAMPCFAPGCSQPAIRQCPGFKSSCGRFYCQTHREGTLCAVCAQRKGEYDAAQDTIREYVKLAESVPQTPGVSALLGAVGVWAAIYLLGAALVPSVSVLAFLLGAIIGVVWWISRTKQKASEIQNKIREIDRVKPHFAEFYNVWLAHTSASADEIISGLMSSGVGIAGGALLVGLAAANTYKDSSSS